MKFWIRLSTMDIGQTQRLLILLDCLCSIVSCAAHQQFNLILLVTLWCMPSHRTMTTHYQPMGWLKENRLPTWKLGYDIGIPCCDACFLLVSSKWRPALLVITWLPQSWRCLSQHNCILNHWQDLLLVIVCVVCPWRRSSFATQQGNGKCFMQFRNLWLCKRYAVHQWRKPVVGSISHYNSLLPNSILVLWQIWPDICHDTVELIDVHFDKIQYWLDWQYSQGLVQQGMKKVKPQQHWAVHRRHEIW